MKKILNTPGLTCDNTEAVIQALALFAKRHIDSFDAYNVCSIKTKGISEIYSYDQHYDRLNWLERIEPQQ